MIFYFISCTNNRLIFARFGGSRTIYFQNLLLTINSVLLNTCACGALLHLELLALRSATEKLLQRPTGIQSEVVGFEVLEPQEYTPGLAFPALSSSVSYRIPRLPPAAPINPEIRRLSAKKATLLACSAIVRHRKRSTVGTVARTKEGGNVKNRFTLLLGYLILIS